MINIIVAIWSGQIAELHTNRSPSVGLSIGTDIRTCFRRAGPERCRYANDHASHTNLRSLLMLRTNVTDVTS